MSIIPDFVDVTLKLPERIKKGLANGAFTREGGVIRKGNGEIVTFLRESSGLSQELAKGNLPSSPWLSSQISSLRFLSTAALDMQVLNFGISAIGFSVVISKLNKMQADLQAIRGKLDRILGEILWISQKQDLEIIAKMKAALEIADGAALSLSKRRRQEDLLYASRQLHKSAEDSKVISHDLIMTKNIYPNPDFLISSIEHGYAAVLPSCSVNCG